MSNKPKRRRRKPQQPQSSRAVERHNHMPSSRSQQVRQDGNGQITATQITFVGPLPPPEMLAEYEKLVPGFAERTLSEWEKQGTHRRTLEATVITSNAKSQERAQPIAAICFVSVAIAAAVCGVAGNTGAAIAIAGMDLAGFGGLFIWGKVKQGNERADSVG